MGWSIKNGKLYCRNSLVIELMFDHEELENTNALRNVYVKVCHAHSNRILYIKIIYPYNKIKVDEQLQLSLIADHKISLSLFTNPTENAKALYKLLWEL